MNTEEEIKKLKEKVTELEDTQKDLVSDMKRVFEWANTISGGAGGGGDAAEETTDDDLYEVVSFDVKKKPKDGNFQPFAWKLKVKNTSNKKITLSADIIAQDSDEFDVEESGTSPFEIKAGSTATETGIIEIFEEHKVAQIKEWTCKFHVY
jgi:hypothetical protein